ncbi:MAG TPA: response regulator, partial [Candidatus Methylomirabilis sp.]|nr:response regulator [Candidatus Methylomirabilis sp.]
RLEDTGEGIPDEHRRRIFDPFFTTRGPQHLGLGLTIAHGVITRYGGRLEISSAPASGTRAVLWLPGVETSASTKWPQRAATAPIEIPPEPRAAERAPSPERPGLTPTSPRGPAPREDRPSQGAGAPVAAEAGSASPCSGGASVLVLEDDAPVRALLVESLSRAGYRVDSAADGASGLAKLEGGAFDVVLTDLALPERSGLAMARAVKQLSPRTPVVLITGWAHLLDPGRVRDHGVDLVLVKPFRIERVLTVVADALQLRCQS